MFKKVTIYFINMLREQFENNIKRTTMKKIIATYSLKHLSATTIQKKAKKWIQQKHHNCDANYTSLAIFQFIETLLNREKTVTIENGSPQVNGLKIAD